MAQITVTSIASSGAGSLAEAVAIANATAENDQIIFSDALAGQTITLTERLEITQGVVSINGDIDGDLETDITISGDANGDGVANAGDAKLLSVAAGAQGDLFNLAFTLGFDGRAGELGVIQNLGELSLIRTSITESVSEGDVIDYGGFFSGAAIVANFGEELAIFDSVLLENTATGGAGDGSDGPNNVAGILSASGVLSIDRVGFGGTAVGGQGAFGGYDGGAGVVGIVVTGGALQGDGGDARIGIVDPSTALGGLGGVNADFLGQGASGPAVFGLLQARAGVTYINEVAIGVSGTDVADALGDATAGEGQLLFGFGGADRITGGAGGDTLFGGQGDDTFTASGGSDLVIGGPGADRIEFFDFADAVTAARADDGVLLSVGGATVLAQETEIFDFNDISISRNQIELAIDQNNGAPISLGDLGGPTSASDFLEGDRRANQISALGGDDTVLAAGGADSVNGGAGADSILGGGGADTLFGAGGGDTISGGGGRDQIEGAGGRDRLIGDGGADLILGGGGRDTISGGGGADRINGDGGRDVLSGDRGRDIVDGGRGADLLFASGGRDVLIGGAGRDRFDFRQGDGVDVIADFQQGLDRIQISGGAGNFSDLNISQSGVDVVIRGTGFRIIVETDSASAFRANDFIFVDPTTPVTQRPDRDRDNRQNFTEPADFPADDLFGG